MHIIIDEIYVSFPLNYILRINGQNLTIFCMHIIIDDIYVGIVKLHFSQFSTELRPLIDVRIWFCSISWQRMKRIKPNFVYTLTLKRSRLWL